MDVDIKRFSIFKNIKKQYGVLLPIEFSELPFVPKRIFFVMDLEKGHRRGNHAHKECRQVLACLKGVISVYLNDGNEEDTLDLYESDSIFLDKMTWDSYEFVDKNSILVVFCSEEYDEDDYIKDMELFKRLVKERKRWD